MGTKNIQHILSGPWTLSFVPVNCSKECCNTVLYRNLEICTAYNARDHTVGHDEGHGNWTLLCNEGLLYCFQFHEILLQIVVFLSEVSFKVD